MTENNPNQNCVNGIEVTVGGIIYNDKGEILLIKSKKFKDQFVIPGGHIDKDESFINAFKREIKEETNLEVADIQLLDFDEAINPDFFHRPVHFIFLHFAAKAKSQEVKLNDEGQEYLWIKPEEALKRSDTSASQKVIQHYLQFKDCSPAKFEEYLRNWQRALADYDNLKKETAREKEAVGKFAQALAAMRFAEVYDNLKKALAHEIADVKQWAIGVEHIKRQFGEILKQMGIEEIKTVSEKFDPACHEAVGEEKVKSQEAGIVVREVEGGYKMGDKVIKAAKVIVSK